MKNNTINKDYSIFANYYDEINEEFWKKYKNTFFRLIKNKKSSNCDVLDLGCGTGSSIKYLSTFGFTNIEGVDISKSMIKIAKNKYPKIKFHIHDMTSFKFYKKYDLILCNFDAINYLLTQSKWKIFFLIDIRSYCPFSSKSLSTNLKSAFINCSANS